MEPRFHAWRRWTVADGLNRDKRSHVSSVVKGRNSLELCVLPVITGTHRCLIILTCLVIASIINFHTLKLRVGSTSSCTCNYNFSHKIEAPMQKVLEIELDWKTVFYVIYQQRRRVFHHSNTEKLMKTRGRRPSAFIVSRCLDDLTKQSRIINNR